MRINTNPITSSHLNIRNPDSHPNILQIQGHTHKHKRAISSSPSTSLYESHRTKQNRNKGLNCLPFTYEPVQGRVETIFRSLILLLFFRLCALAVSASLRICLARSVCKFCVLGNQWRLGYLCSRQTKMQIDRCTDRQMF